jgi:CDP-paratose 2-epimerase
MSRHYLVTGGAGFIGSNYAARLLSRGEKVTIYDNLSRAGSILNLKWLHDSYGESAFRLVSGDVRNATLLTDCARDVDVIVHLASQVAVTTSVLHPREDFEINALGTLNVIEAARLSDVQPIVLYASTNKVYGGMEEVAIAEEATRYAYADLPMGVPETQPGFHSPYGCSKALETSTSRLPSHLWLAQCGATPKLHLWTRQFGVEDQGWVAWLSIAAILGVPSQYTGMGSRRVTFSTSMIF